MKSKVSVIMPVLNGQKYIAEALQSVAVQTYTCFEVLVIDDGSTDATSDIVQTFVDRLDIKYKRHCSTRGIAPSMNDGLSSASGDFIAFLDHDDAWFPDFLQIQVNYLQLHPEVAMVHSDFQMTDETGRVIVPSVAKMRGKIRPSGNVFAALFKDSFIVGNSVLIRRECFTQLGPFDERLRWGDYHMWMRIARHYRIDYVDRVLTQYRQHQTQSTRTAPLGVSDAVPVALLAIEDILLRYPDVRMELGEHTIRRRIASIYFDQAYSQVAKGLPRAARSSLRKALSLNPFDFRVIKLFALTFLSSDLTELLIGASRQVRRMLFAGPTKRANVGRES